MQLVHKGILIDSTLIISDVHLGMEESLRKEGVMVPRTAYEKVAESMKKLLEQTQPETVIINGDIKHEFGKISDQEWREVLKFIELIQEHAKLILIKGNHDKVTDIIAEKRNLPVYDYYMVGDVYVTHGDVIPDNEDFKKAKTIIIGHEHPAIALTEGAKKETYKCFVKGIWKGKELYVLPSFTPLTEGVDIQREKLLSPFLKEMDKVEVIVSTEEKLYPFGTIHLV